MLRFVLLVMSFAVPADGQEIPLGFDLGAAKLDVAPDAGVRVADRVGVRADIGFASRERLSEPTPADIDGSVRRRGGGAMLDLYPDVSGFRLSAGVRVSPDRMRLATGVTRMRSSVRIRNWAPSLTAGYVDERPSGMTIGLEAGALFQGLPQMRRADGLVAFDNDFKDGRLCGLVQVSLGYRF